MRDVRTHFRSDAYGSVMNSGWTYDISPVDGRFLMRRSSRDVSTTPATIEVTLHWAGDLPRLFPAG